MATHFHLTKAAKGPIPARSWLGLDLDVTIEIGIHMDPDLMENPKKVLDYFIVKVEGDFQKSAPQLFSGTEFSRNTEVIDEHDVSYTSVKDIFAELDPDLQRLILNAHPDQVVKDVNEDGDSQVDSAQHNHKIGDLYRLPLDQGAEGSSDPKRSDTSVQGEHSKPKWFGTLPVDDFKRSFSDSLLPESMIHAGEMILEKIEDEKSSPYIPGASTDWDYGMMAVAVYRAMCEGSQVDDPTLVVDRVLNQGKTPEQLAQDQFNAVMLQVERLRDGTDDPHLQAILANSAAAMKLSREVRTLRGTVTLHNRAARIVGKRYRHLRRGSEYLVKGKAVFRTFEDLVAWEGDPLVFLVEPGGQIIAMLEKELLHITKIRPKIGESMSPVFPNYIFGGELNLQCNLQSGIKDGDTLILYRSFIDDSLIWGRKDAEFFDGRFEEVPNDQARSNQH